MNTPYQMLRAFHQHMGLTCRDTPKLMSLADWKLYWPNHDSEWLEFHESTGKFKDSLNLIASHSDRRPDLREKAEHALAHMLKEACDVVYTAIAPFVAMGIDFDEAFRRVHESNMAKDPALRGPNGKILKPPGWEPPALVDLVRLGNGQSAMGNGEEA